MYKLLGCPFGNPLFFLLFFFPIQISHSFFHIYIQLSSFFTHRKFKTHFTHINLPLCLINVFLSHFYSTGFFACDSLASRDYKIFIQLRPLGLNG
jgi:hypothetical protein